MVCLLGVGGWVSYVFTQLALSAKLGAEEEPINIVKKL